MLPYVTAPSLHPWKGPQKSEMLQLKLHYTSPLGKDVDYPPVFVKKWRKRRRVNI